MMKYWKDTKEKLTDLHKQAYFYHIFALQLYVIQKTTLKKTNGLWKYILQRQF